MSPQPPAERGRAPGRNAGVAGTIMRGAIRLYRLTLSAFFGRTCRYLPTCSEYAEDAIGLHGAWAGGWMALARMSRCHPWGADGFDPVPGRLPGAAAWYMPWRYGDWRGQAGAAPETGTKKRP